MDFRLTACLRKSQEDETHKERSYTQLDSRKQVIAFLDRVAFRHKRAQNPLKQTKQHKVYPVKRLIFRQNPCTVLFASMRN